MPYKSLFSINGKAIKLFSFFPIFLLTLVNLGMAQINYPNLNVTAQQQFIYLKDPPKFSNRLLQKESERWPAYFTNQCSQVNSQPDRLKNAKNFSFHQRNCQKEARNTRLYGILSLGYQGLMLNTALGDSIDNGGSSSGNIKVIKANRDLLENWNQSGSFLKAGLNHLFFPGLNVYLELKLKLSIDAWRDRENGLNIPLNISEIAINEPQTGYLNWIPNPLFKMLLGRFPLHWGPSQNTGLLLSHSAPYQDGVLFKVSSKYVEFQSFAGSLNPWLSGTPSNFRDTIPYGSESYIQAHPDYGALPNSDFNSRNLIYKDPIKTLFAHRLLFKLKSLEIGISEINVVGGKTPNFMDYNPFGIYHNNFGDGYSSIAVSTDASLTLPRGFEVYGELVLDEIQERSDEGNPTTLGWMAGLNHITAYGQVKLFQSMEIVKTDPLLYNQKRPLLKLYSRHVLKSNFIEIGKVPFTDTYIADYPLGYFRGADVLDIWYRIYIQLKERNYLTLNLGWLNTGEWNSPKLYRQNSESSPTGDVNRSLLCQINAVHFITNQLLVWANGKVSHSFKKGFLEGSKNYQIFGLGLSYYY